MKLRIISVAHKMPDWITTGCQEYQKRLPQEINTQIITLKPANPQRGVPAALQQEAQQILDMTGNDYLVVLDEHGQPADTLTLVERVQQWMNLGRNITLVIGSANGLHETLLQKAEWQWSLSPLTLPHGMVRVIVLEQLYRAWSILTRHPYHRGE